MTNTNTFWKAPLLALVLCIGALFALPNLFGSDPAVQVSGVRGDLSPSDRDAAIAALAGAGFSDLETRDENGRLLVLFDNESDQLKGKDAITAVLDPNESLTSLNLESASPDWLRNFAEPMYLGLDLRGGVHFLMDVDMDAAIESRIEIGCCNHSAAMRTNCFLCRVTKVSIFTSRQT